MVLHYEDSIWIEFGHDFHMFLNKMTTSSTESMYQLKTRKVKTKINLNESYIFMCLYQLSIKTMCLSLLFYSHIVRFSIDIQQTLGNF